MTSLAPLRPPGIRPGHHAPIGSVTTMRFEWPDPDELPVPDLGDVLEQVSAAGADDADHVQRAYLVVGFLEGATPDRFRLAVERLAWPGAPAAGKRTLSFFNLPRGT